MSGLAAEHSMGTKLKLRTQIWDATESWRAAVRRAPPAALQLADRMKRPGAALPADVWIECGPRQRAGGPDGRPLGSNR